MPIADSNTKIRLQGNNDATVAAWNFVTPIGPSDNYQLVWNAVDSLILGQTGLNTGPNIPSAIVTVTQVP